MAVDDLDGRFIRNTDMIRLNPHELAILLVCFINALVSFALPTLCQEPQIAELCSEWSWYISYAAIGSEVWHEPEEHEAKWNYIWTDKEIEDSHFALFVWRGSLSGTTSECTCTFEDLKIDQKLSTLII